MPEIPVEDDASEESFLVVEPDLVAVNVEIETEAEKEPSQAEKVCSDTAENKTSETMEVEIDPEAKPLNESDDEPVPDMHIKGLKIVQLLHKDQLDLLKGLTDMQIVCEDGYVPMHRYVLMAASTWIHEILIMEDPSELAVIHMPDVKLAHIVQVLSVLYSGTCLQGKADQLPVYKILKMLGVDTESFDFRATKPEDKVIIRKLRYYEKESESKEEDFIPNILQSESPDIPASENDVGSGLIEDNIVPHDEVEVTPGSQDEAGPKRKGRKRGQKYRGKKRAANRKAAINIVDVSKLCEKEDEGDQNMNEDDKLEMEVPEPEGHNKKDDVDDDVIFEEEVIHPPNSKKTWCEPSSSSAAGSSTDGLQFRNSKPGDESILGKERFCENGLKSKEAEFIPMQRDSQEIPTVEARGKNDPGAEMIEENIAQYDKVEKTRGLRVVSKSQKDKAETAKFMSVEMGMSKGENALIQTDHKIKCPYCYLVYASEENLLEHLSSSCGSHLLGKYSYAKKQCLGCCRRFPSYTLNRLINHVESCKRLEVAFSATASQFVNGNLPPVSAKETNLDQLDEMGNEMYPHGSNSGAKGKNGPSTGEEPKSRGRKRGQKNREKKGAANRKAAIKIVDVSTLGEKEDEGDQNLKDDGKQLEVEVQEHEDNNKTEDVDDDVIFEKEVICPPHSKKPRCEPSSSSAAGSSDMMMPSGKSLVIQDLEEQEKNDYVIENYPSGVLETTRKALGKKQMKTLETLNRGLANEKVSTYVTGNATNHEQNMNNGEIEEIIIDEDSEGQNIYLNGDDPITAGADLELIINDGEVRKDEQQQPKTRHSQAANQRRINNPPAVTTSASAQNLPLIKPPQPILGRVLLELKEIEGQIYNIYGLINPTSTDPKNKFSKVIAILNTDVQARAEMEQMKKQSKPKQ